VQIVEQPRGGHLLVIELPRRDLLFHGAAEEFRFAHSVHFQHPLELRELERPDALTGLERADCLFADAGYRVGLVTPSTIAALPVCPAPGAGLRVVAKVAGSTLSVLLSERGRVRLVRCVDLASGEGDEMEQEESILPSLEQTLAYAEVQIGQPASRLLLCGFGSATEAFGRLAQQELGIPFTSIRSKFGPASQQNAGLLGLLEQYAA